MGKKKGGLHGGGGRGGGGGGTRRAFKKDPVATKVAAGVKKTKTKAVSSNLKRMNFQTRAQTEAVNAEFAQLQQQQRRGKKAEVSSSAVKAEVERVVRPEPEEPDVDMAAEELSRLTSTM